MTGAGMSAAILDAWIERTRVNLAELLCAEPCFRGSERWDGVLPNGHATQVRPGGTTMNFKNWTLPGKRNGDY